MTTRSAAPLRAARPHAILAFLCVAQFMVFLDVSIVNVALPSIRDALGASDSTLTYVVTAYGTVLGGCLLLGGRLADAFGRRRVLQVGLVLFALASLAAGSAQDAHLLVAARAAQGLGAALVAPSALSLVTATFPSGPARTTALGIWGSLTGLASVCGVLLGGVMTEWAGWRLIFLVNVPIGLVAAAVAPRVLAESRSDVRRAFDVVGAVLLTGALLLTIWTLDEAVDAGWTAPRTVGGLAVGVGLLVLFLRHEARVEAPLLPRGLLRRRAVGVANASALLALGAVTTTFYFLSLFMQNVVGMTPFETGVAYVPLATSVVVGAVASGVLVSRWGGRIVLVTGTSLTAVGLLVATTLPLDATPWHDLLPVFVLLGIGMGIAFVPLQVAVLDGVPAEDSGGAAGVNGTSQEAGGALGLAITSTIALTHLERNLDPADPVGSLAASFDQAFLAGAGLLVLATLIALALPAGSGRVVR